MTAIKNFRILSGIVIILAFASVLSAQDVVKISTQDKMTSWNTTFTQGETLHIQVGLNAEEAILAESAGWQLVKGDAVIREGALTTRSFGDLRDVLPAKNLPSGDYTLRVAVNGSEDELLAATLPVRIIDAENNVAISGK